MQHRKIFRLTALLLVLSMMAGMVPLTGLAANEYTITLKQDVDGKINAVPFFIQGASSPNAAVRPINQPIQISSTAINQLRMQGVPTDMVGFKITIGDFSIQKVLSDIGDFSKVLAQAPEVILGEAGLASKISGRTASQFSRSLAIF